MIKNACRQLLLLSCLIGSSAPAFCEPQAMQVLGEQVDGSLIQSEEEGWMLTPNEITNCDLNRPSDATCTMDVAPLPSIFVSVESGYYDQIPVVVRKTHYEHRRRSLASRGAHSTAGPVASVTETVVYRSVYRRAHRKCDITPIIMKNAQKFNLDPWMIRGVIEVESAFRPYAQSCAGAGGLMQLMPGTASYLGCRDRFDPEQNIAAGARYLRQMLNRFDNNYDLAIAAYNAGPGNVERYGGIPPFAETQHYVRKVRKAWSWRP